MELPLWSYRFGVTALELPLSAVYRLSFRGEKSIAFCRRKKYIYCLNLHMTMTIKENLLQIQEKISAACARVGRSEQDVSIVAVSKTVTAEQIREAIEADINIIGENRVQEAWAKVQQVGRIAKWHMVGHLQTNKVKQALKIFDVIESVDSLHLAQEISKRASAEDRTVEILVEVNTSGEESKFGTSPDTAVDLVAQIAELDRLRVSGLMTIGAFLPDPEKVRPCFVTLRKLADEINAQNIPNVKMCHLSMGMTNDYEVAIEEGATLVRIGRAIFGER